MRRRVGKQESDTLEFHFSHRTVTRHDTRMASMSHTWRLSPAKPPEHTELVIG